MTTYSTGAYKLKKSRWENVSADGLDLVKKMLEVDPKKRPTMTEVRNHSWMLDDEAIEKVNKFVLNSRANSFPFSSSSVSSYSV